MANKTSKKLKADFDEKNAKALTDMLTDPHTSEPVRIQIINELNEQSKNQTFFETIFNEELSFGECPCCKHQNHWLIPEDELSQMGWVSHRKDPRVKKHTTSKDCQEFAEACSKKKTTA